MRDPMSIYTVLPAADLARARAFYREKLGLEPTMEKPGMLAYSGPSGYIFQLYETDAAGSARNTQMGWSTSDLDDDVAELRERGVVFAEARAGARPSAWPSPGSPAARPRSAARRRRAGRARRATTR